MLCIVMRPDKIFEGVNCPNTHRSIPVEKDFLSRVSEPNLVCVI